ncbi:MAG: Zn-dependent M28 family amino/carboxypeptidase [Myxococcota bacterium]|jgi:Zn-dependent M28 family amino/carboxypeptidase
MRWSTPWLLVAVLAPASAADPAPSTAALEGTVRALSGADPVLGGAILSRHIDHPDHDRARSWLRDQLGAIAGLEVWDDPFTASSHSDLSNLVADLPGGDPSLPWIVVGAHFDSTASLTEGWNSATDPAPGADDDASGVAAVLELARLLSGEALTHPVRFVLFDGEEAGLLGSEAHVEHYSAGAVALMLSLDPVGHNPGGAGRLWVTYQPEWADAAEAVLAMAEGIDTPLDVASVDGSLLGSNALRSDHAPFWGAGHPALHLASFPQPPDYHEVTDTVDVVDPQFLTDVTALVHAVVRELAVPLEPGARRTSAAAGGCGR